MVVLMDGGTGGASNNYGRQPDPLRKRRTNERHYVFDVAFGADSTQVFTNSLNLNGLIYT